MKTYVPPQSEVIAFHLEAGVMVTASIDINNDSPADFGQDEEDWLSPKKSPADGHSSQYWETR